MKWVCKNTLAVYSYEINVENLFSPVYNLILDLLREHYTGREFNEWVDKVFDVEKVIGQTSVPEYVTEESFLFELSSYLEVYLYGKVDLLDTSDILLLYRTKHILIAPINKGNQILVKWVKRSGMIDKFLELIKSSEINNIRTILSNFMNEQYFGSSIKMRGVSELKGTFVPKSFVKNYEELPIDEESIWICKDWKNNPRIKNNLIYSEIILPDYDGDCIAIGDYILSTEYIDRTVKSEAWTEYFWLMLNNVFARKTNRRSIFRKDCKEFAEALKKADFANLMSGLRYNLYLPQMPAETPDEYKRFFEEVYNIDQFEKDTHQILFTGSHMAEQVEKKQTMFGLYKTVKDDSEFNLRAWINVETVDKQKMAESSGVTKVEIKTVYALKPCYSYYFCKDYFEDMFIDILKESGISSLSNFELYTSEKPSKCCMEIDNMVKKSDGTLVYIENKTTLSRFNIEETLNNVSMFHQIMKLEYPEVHIEYMIVSLYQNETVEEGFSYFTNAEGSSLNDFKIPIARYGGVMLHCIVESEYSKLKNKMEHLLK